MTIFGPLPPSSVQTQNDQTLALRAQQRIAAEVLQVAGDRVLLSVGGVRIVARLLSPENAAELQERRMAQFIVKDLSSDVLGLQLIGADHEILSPALPTDLIPILLERAGMEVNEATRLIARALLAQDLPVTHELAAELQEVLSSLAWGWTEAQTAAGIKAAGLPLTPEALALMLSQLPPLGEALARLLKRLRTSEGQEYPPALEKLIQGVLGFLKESRVEVSNPPEAMAAAIRQALARLGRPLERQLLELLQENPALAEAANPEELDKPGLMRLAQLRQHLAENGSQDWIDELDQALESLRQMHYCNLEPERLPSKGTWLFFDLPITFSGDPADPDTAQVRIAYREADGALQIDPTHTRVVISMNLDQEDSIQVDLSLADQRVGAQVRASSERWREFAEAESPTLAAGLEELGFDLQVVRFNVGGVHPERIGHPSRGRPVVFSQVDREV